MQSVGCAPDVATHSSLIDAYARGGQWLLATDTFNTMISRGMQPDTFVYDTTINALWQSGVVFAQVCRMSRSGDEIVCW
jgi:pentatricopeptide repeat protein